MDPEPFLFNQEYEETMLKDFLAQDQAEVKQFHAIAFCSNLESNAKEVTMDDPLFHAAL